MSRVLVTETELDRDELRARAATKRQPFSHGPQTRVCDQDWRLELIRRYGSNTLAYSTAVQAGLSYFSERDGYIAFVKKWGHIHVLGDPIVSASDRGALLDAFLARFPKAGFYQVSRDTAQDLAARRFYVNEMGVDTRIDLPSYDFSGKSKEYLRYAGNWLKRRGFRIEERSLAVVSRGELEELNSRWKSTRRIKSEVRFLNRPLTLEEEPDVRRFFLIDPNDRLLGFVFFDPLFENGHIVGYATAFKRRDATETNGYAEPGIMRTAIEVFQREGCSILRLGLSPLANITDSEFRKNWFLHHSFRYGFNAWWVNRYFYNLRGHAAFKQRFCGVEEKAYFATRSISNDLRIAGMLRYAGII